MIWSSLGRVDRIRTSSKIETMDTLESTLDGSANGKTSGEGESGHDRRLGRFPHSSGPRTARTQPLGQGGTFRSGMKARGLGSRHVLRRAGRAPPADLGSRQGLASGLRSGGLVGNRPNRCGAGPGSRLIQWLAWIRSKPVRHGPEVRRRHRLDRKWPHT